MAKSRTIKAASQILSGGGTFTPEFRSKLKRIAIQQAEDLKYTQTLLEIDRKKRLTNAVCSGKLEM